MKKPNKYPLIILLSAAAFFLLRVSLELKSLVLMFGVTGALAILCLVRGSGEQFSFSTIHSRRKEFLIGSALLAASFCSFFDNWSRSGKVADLAARLHIPAVGLAAAAGLVLMAAAVPFVLEVLWLLGWKREAENTLAGTKKHALWVCTLTAVGVITVCSKSSPLYPFNDWVDANCFFTVGKAMMNGIVMYRDLWEQKGPFLYFLHGIASLISGDSFFGVYLLEVVAAFLFLYCSFLSLRLFVSEIHAAASIPLLAAVVYTSPAFCHGDSAEELCLPILAYTLLVSLRAFCREQEISPKEYLFVGIGAGLVFWTKYTMVGFYLGWYLLPALMYVQQRQWRKLWTSVWAVAAGVGIATLPFALYFGWNHAIGDWLEVYIYNNLFLYTVNESDSAGMGLLQNLYSGYEFSLRSGLSLVLCTLVGGVWLALSEKRKVSSHFFLTILLTFVVTFMGGRQYDYYTFSLAVFVPYGVAAVLQLFAGGSKLLEKVLYGKLTGTVLAVICIAFTLLTTQNRYLLGVEKEELPQYQFREIITRSENPTLLNYGFLDGGFYTASDVLPNCKAFCKLNIPLEEMTDMQEQYVKEGLCDFVVTRDYELHADNYKCVAQSQFPNKEGTVQAYYLYQLIQEEVDHG